MALWPVLTNSIGSIVHTIVFLKPLWILSTQPVSKYIVCLLEESVRTLGIKAVMQMTLKMTFDLFVILSQSLLS